MNEMNEMKEFLNSLWGKFDLISIGTSQILNGVVLLIAYPWLSKKIEYGFKDQYDKELETIKSNLSRLNSEHQIRFTKLQEQQALAIADVYSKLQKLHFDLVQYTKPFRPVGGQDLDSARKVAVDSYKSFFETYITRLIYFPKDLADKLEQINSDMKEALLKFEWNVELTQHSGSDATREWQKIFDKVSVDIKQSIVEIEDRFRSLLGIAPTT